MDSRFGFLKFISAGIVAGLLMAACAPAAAPAPAEAPTSGAARAGSQRGTFHCAGGRGRHRGLGRLYRTWGQ